jgi:hypothetical protein
MDFMNARRAGSDAGFVPATVEVPAGIFVMGSATGRPDEAPPHAVTVSAFRIGRTPVTNAQFAPFLAASRCSAPRWWANPAFGAPEQPVVGVTWLEACAYARWLGDTALRPTVRVQHRAFLISGVIVHTVRPTGCSMRLDRAIGVRSTSWHRDRPGQSRVDGRKGSRYE